MKTKAEARTMPTRNCTDRESRVRQVTLSRVSWIEGDQGAQGALTLRLVADQEVDEYVLQATPDDAARLLEFVEEDTEAQGQFPSRVWALATLMHT